MSTRDIRRSRGWLRHSTALIVGGVLAISLAPSAYAAPPSNDDGFTDFVVAPSLPFSDTRDTSEATFTPGDSGCGAATVWYSFTADTDGAYRFDTSGSDYDTTLAVFFGNAAAKSFLSCNNGSPGYQSVMDLQLWAGTTYYVEVGTCCTALEFGQVGPGGNLVFSLDHVPAFDIQLTLDPRGKLGTELGTAIVSGTVTCNGPANYGFAIVGNLRQKQGLNIARGDLYVATGCTTTPTTWTATVDAGSRVFLAKDATLTATAFGCYQFGEPCDEVTTSRTIRLRR